MQVRHNTSLLEQAVSQVVRQREIPTLQAQAAAFNARERATGFKRLATGAAIALAAIGLGWGLRLAFPHFFVDQDVRTAAPSASAVAEVSSIAVEVSSVEPAPSSSSQEHPPMPVPLPQASGPTGPPTMDYDKFLSQDVKEFGQSWTIVSGHHFASDTDDRWERAWCYTNHLVDGVSVQIALVNRDTPFSRALAPLATHETLAKAGLSDDDALLLATLCPWLDGQKYAKGDFVADPTITRGASSSEEPAASSEEPVQLTGAYVQFGSYGSRELANSEMVLYQAKWVTYLRGQKMIVQPVAFGQSEVRYNIRASYPEIDAAKQVCSIIAAHGGDCFADAY